MRKNSDQITRRLRGRAAQVVVVVGALAVVGVGVPVGFIATAAATTPAPSQHLFTPQPTTATASTDAKSVELGVKFTPAVSGQILGVEFLKSTHNIGTHTGSLWTAAGALLATATFVNETASGWQSVIFSTPINVTAGTAYTAGYHAPVGRYDSTPAYFSTSHTSGDLRTPVDASRKSYSSQSVLPTLDGGNNSNYWVDVVFVSSAVSPTPTATPSPSATVTPLPSTTPTTTPTSTPSSSPSPSGSASPTPTPSATVTSTPTPTPTVTSTPSPTPTVTTGHNGPCLSVPSACGDPDATNTGATGALVVHAGNLTTTADGQVIANLDIQGCLIDVNSGVVIKNVKIEGGCTWSLDAHRATGPLTMTNVTVIGTGAQMSAVVVHDDATVTGLNAAGGNDIFDTWGGTTTIVDSYLHDPTRNAGGSSHDDDFQLTGGTATLTHVTLIAPIAAQANSCVQIGDLSGSSNGFTMVNSLCQGGNYSINANGSAVKLGNVTVGPLRFTGNRFGTGYRYGVNTNLGAPFTTTWSGNVDDSTGNSV